MEKVLVIGGGASGMMAAIAAAGQGAEVTILEQNEQLGKRFCPLETENAILQILTRYREPIVENIRNLPRM